MSTLSTRIQHPPGMVVREHELIVPLDHADPAGEQLKVFARELADPEGQDKPFLVFLQGGPGYEAPRTSRPAAPAWIDRALQEFRVLLLDQRGTGRSTPIGTLAGRTPAEQAHVLRHHRADAIVRDAELLREALGVERWGVLGQSFGGFCVLRYLSAAPDGLNLALFTGGLPPIGRHVDEIYAATYATVLRRNAAYHERYPEDGARLRTALDRADAGEIVLPTGDVLSARRLRMIGNELGTPDGPETLHHLLEQPTDSPAFTHDVIGAAMDFARNPLYAILHESSYADGVVTGWSAHRLLPSLEEHPELLTGEHVFPWLFDEIGALAPLKEAAELLAVEPWPRLYDAGVLAANTVPAAAIIYAEDLYVDRRFSEETAAAVRGLRPWLTNEYEHNGLRVDGGRILGHLLDLARGRV